MITKFDTAVSKSGKGGNTIIWILALAGLAYVGYNYFLKPKQDEKK